MFYILFNFRLYSVIIELKVLYLVENVERIREKIFLSGLKIEKKLKRLNF